MTLQLQSLNLLLEIPRLVQLVSESRQIYLWFCSLEVLSGTKSARQGKVKNMIIIFRYLTKVGYYHPITCSAEGGCLEEDV